MAQRTIHYAICNELLKTNKFKDENKMKLGMILPDASNFDGVPRNIVHFVKEIGKEKIYDLTDFRNKYSKYIKTDDLFLGYYLHLVQDMIYRKFLYVDHKIWPKDLSERDIWYSDYHILNKYIINKYNLVNDIQKINNFSDENINKICRFDIDRLLNDFADDFRDNSAGNAKIIKENLMDEYIKICVDVCNQELDLLKNNKKLIDEKMYKYTKNN